MTEPQRIPGSELVHNTLLGDILSQSVGTTESMPDLAFHQGLLTAFDTPTGTNAVMIAGTNVVDIPMLNIGDTINLHAGDVVMVLRVRTQYFIVGRIVVPNSEVFATSAVGYTTADPSTSGFALGTVEAIVLTHTINVPAWSNWATTYAIGTLNAQNSRVVADFAYCSTWIDTNNGNQSYIDVPAGGYGFMTASNTTNREVTPGGSFDITLRADTGGGAWAASAFNVARMSIVVTFRKLYIP